MSDKQDESAANSLGLTLETLKLDESPAPASDSTDAPTKPAEEPVTDVPAAPATQDEEVKKEDAVVDTSVSVETDPTSPQTPTAGKEKKKQPYVNPDRVRTGGAQRDKLSEEELAERMVRIREQNEKIKARREDVKKDEDEFRKTQEAERIKQVKAKKVQENVDRAREQNARRKLDKIQSREWDTGKPGVKPITPTRSNEGGNDANAPPSPAAKIGIRGGFRGGGRGGPGRGRGRGTSVNNAPREEKAEVEATPTSPSAPAPAPVSEAQPEAAAVASS
ncbi:Severe Depolymerization of Actin [Steccherinum ochraceum]|uniref:Severe Depolymerization of Actin n=1 Tax=Steccherinum ochraceum TaxID=92696 RepID=A0A4R0RXE0_9APHY|nr:Severe Depolymerization of Actin [Steccherinum ochraceum]